MWYEKKSVPECVPHRNIQSDDHREPVGFNHIEKRGKNRGNAGRRIPAVFNGMATGADWMSAASFIGLAGTLYLSGHQGLAYVMGWTGGYVLVALLLAPYLRRFGQYTIPDFLGARYGGNAPRLVGVLATVLASFVYVVAQIYGVGVITSRFVGLQFEIGVFVGLAGILVCSFLGGMRAVTWTQVAQYVILIIAYLVPVVILSYKLTGIPIPQASWQAGAQGVGMGERPRGPSGPGNRLAVLVVGTTALWDDGDEDEDGVVLHAARVRADAAASRAMRMGKLLLQGVARYRNHRSLHVQ